MTRTQLARFAKTGVEAEIVATCADMAECGFSEYRAEKLQRLFQKYEEVTAELKAARKEERENEN